MKNDSQPKYEKVKSYNKKLFDVPETAHRPPLKSVKELVNETEPMKQGQLERAMKRVREGYVKGYNEAVNKRKKPDELHK